MLRTCSGPLLLTPSPAVTGTTVTGGAVCWIERLRLTSFVLLPAALESSPSPGPSSGCWTPLPPLLAMELNDVTPEAEIYRVPALAATPAGATAIADAITAKTADDVTNLCLNTLPSCCSNGSAPAWAPSAIILEDGLSNVNDLLVHVKGGVKST